MKNNREIYREKLKEYSMQNSINQVEKIEEIEEDEYTSESILEKIRDFISYNKKYIFIIILILTIILVISLLIYKEKNKNEGWDNLIDYINDEYDGKLEKESGDYNITVEILDKKTIQISCFYVYVGDISENMLIYVDNFYFNLIKNETECKIYGNFIAGEEFSKVISANLKISNYMRDDNINWSISVMSGISRKNNEMVDSYISDIYNIQFSKTIEVLESILHDSDRDITMSDIGFYLY